MDMKETTQIGMDKIARYGWMMKDAPGEMIRIDKDDLLVHPAYQRDLIVSKVKAISAAWSWIALGVLVVGLRENKYWVIDGQHRLVAAKRRSDISALPCLVFQTSDLKDEAQGFLDLNTGRKPVSAIARQKALVVAGDEVAAFVAEVCQSLGITITPNAHSPGNLKCIAWCNRRAADDKDEFRAVMTLATEICMADKMPVAERLLEGLWRINAGVEDGLHNKRLVKRIREKGARTLLDAANRAAAYFNYGGGKAWATGILAELNKGLINRFIVTGVDS